jgi:hypothetical protein
VLSALAFARQRLDDHCGYGVEDLGVLYMGGESTSLPTAFNDLMHVDGVIATATRAACAFIFHPSTPFVGREGVLLPPRGRPGEE